MIIAVINGTHPSLRSDPYSPGAVLRVLHAQGWVIPPEEHDAHELFHVILTSLEEEAIRPKKVYDCNLPDLPYLSTCISNIFDFCLLSPRSAVCRMRCRTWDGWCHRRGHPAPCSPISWTPSTTNRPALCATFGPRPTPHPAHRSRRSPCAMTWTTSCRTSTKSCPRRWSCPSVGRVRAKTAPRWGTVRAANAAPGPIVRWSGWTAAPTGCRCSANRHKSRFRTRSAARTAAKWFAPAAATSRWCGTTNSTAFRCRCRSWRTRAWAWAICSATMWRRRICRMLRASRVTRRARTPNRLPLQRWGVVGIVSLLQATELTVKMASMYS